MSNGLIQQVDQPTVIYDYPVNRFVAAFIGTPAMNFIEGRIDPTNPSSFHSHYNETIALHMPGRAALTTLSKRTVVLGIRPEQFANTQFVPAPPDATIINMRVQLIEIMGDHQYVYLNMGDEDTLLTMKCDAHHRVKVGDHIPISIDTRRAHIFDGTDEFAKNVTIFEQKA
jgi:multiple sugar transport system ATP-binding protein